MAEPCDRDLTYRAGRITPPVIPGVVMPSLVQSAAEADAEAERDRIIPRASIEWEAGR